MLKAFVLTVGHCFGSLAAAVYGVLASHDLIYRSDSPLRWVLLQLPQYWGFSAGSDSKEFACNAGELDSISGLGTSSGRRHGNSLQYSCLENLPEWRSLVGYSPWGHKELDTTE